MEPTIVSREEWLTARKALLAQERDVTHLRDRVNAARRALPWVKVDTPYIFEAADGPISLGDLFDGRSQLFVQHFMLAPESDHICPGCACFADHVDASRRHFEHADLSFAAISRAPIDQIEQARKRMGWTFRWVSCGGNSFSYDYGASFTPEQVASGNAGYNYGTTPYAAPDMPANSVFAKNAAGEVFHTYSTYARGNDGLVGPFTFLDLVPKGRNENGAMSWVRLHDEYDAGPTAEACCNAGD